jgi:putative sugar O-methyltransferase
MFSTATRTATETSDLQVDDDAQLLQLMMADAAAAPPEYQATNFWNVYEQRLLPELSRLGLRDFRRRRNSVLSSMGATDLIPRMPRADFRRSLATSRLSRLPGWWRMLGALTELADRLPPGSDDISYARFQKLAFEYAELVGEVSGARPLRAFGMSLVGSPEEQFEVDGQAYSRAYLDYYLSYAYCARFCDFEGVESIAELGSGGGKQIELLKKLHPHLTIFAFDIPPQLYVCEQYLKAVFPEAVVSYREARELSTLGDVPRGSIVILGSRQFPLISQGVDLFWNAASFQEMEPPIVANYLGFVDAHAGAAFLQQVEHGHQIAATPGALGVLEQTTFEHYRKGLPSLELLDVSAVRRATGREEQYANGFWTRPGWPHLRIGD